MDMMRGRSERLPNECARLEAIEGGTLVRFQEAKEIECQVPRHGETWRGETDARIKALVAIPVAVFCDTPEKLVAAIERAKSNYTKIAANYSPGYGPLLDCEGTDGA